MARTELYEDSRGALLKSVRAEFRTTWNMTNQWRNQRHIKTSRREGVSITSSSEIKMRKKERKKKQEKKERQNNEEKRWRKIVNKVRKKKRK